MWNKGAKDVWWLEKNNGKIYATTYIVVLDLYVYGRKKPTTMFFIILWLLGLIILGVLEGVSTWDILAKKSISLGNELNWMEQCVVYQAKYERSIFLKNNIIVKMAVC